MPRCLLEACHGGCGSGNKDHFYRQPLAGDSGAFEHRSQKSTGGVADELLRPLVYRGRRLRSSYGDFLQAPGLPSEVSTSSGSQTDQSGSFNDEYRPASIPPTDAQALAAQISAELKDAIRTMDEMQTHVTTAPLAGRPGRADLEHSIVGYGGDGETPLLEHARSESNGDHQIHHSPKHSGGPNHYVIVKQHVAAHAVNRHPEPPTTASEPPPKAHEPNPKMQQELDQGAAQQLQEPRLADWQPQIILGGVVAMFAQAYLWGNVFVTLFKPARSSTATQPGEATQAPAPAPASAPAPAPSAPIVLTGAGGRLQEQAVAAAPAAVDVAVS